MECVIMRNFTDSKTKAKYSAGTIVKFSAERVKEIQEVEKEKEIKLIRLVKNSGLKKDKKKK